MPLAPRAPWKRFVPWGAWPLQFLCARTVGHEAAHPGLVVALVPHLPGRLVVPARSPLPIDEALPRLLAALREHPVVVLQAPPGAGKTTRVPQALLESWEPSVGQILVLEPRRLAARLAARRVAQELGEPVGERCGYQVRFEDQSSPRTRIKFLTEGILSRQLGSEGSLAQVGVVVLDEFHERSVHADVALGVLRRWQQTSRPELRLLLMSATLDAEALASTLGAPIVSSLGRSFEVTVEHLKEPDDRPMEKQVASAVRRLLLEGLDGHVLVFLPGAAEIRRCAVALEPLAQQGNLRVLPLHGELSVEEQERALAPSETRKILLATNVAESSVTVEGVTTVIDSGWVRRVSSSPWTGLPQRSTRRISKASAVQRAGRAGRTRPGRCLRLYTASEHARLADFEPPEITQTELGELALLLGALGLSASEIPWLDAPPEAPWNAALTLLKRLGALDDAGKLTPMGRQMQRIPLTPRLSRLVLEGARRGCLREACICAALLSERDIRVSRVFGPSREGAESVGARGLFDSDMLERLDAFERAKEHRWDPATLRELSLDGQATRAVERASTQLQALARKLQDVRREGSSEAALDRCLLAAFSDRVARRRAPRGAQLVLVGGVSAALSESSDVRSAPLLLALDAEESQSARGAKVSVRLAAPVDPLVLMEEFPERIREQRELSWNPTAERVEVSAQLLFDDLVLEEARVPGAGAPGVAARLAKEALARGLVAVTTDPERLERWLQRVAFVASLEPTFPTLDSAALTERISSACEGLESFDELRAMDLQRQLSQTLSEPERARLEAWAPERLTLGNGRQAQVHYEPGKPPWLQSFLQDFFGCTQTPVIAQGRVALVLHLLAPNRRAVQITSDLASFWKNHYPGVRKELARSYPRHRWPEDPLTASPPELTRPPRHG